MEYLGFLKALVLFAVVLLVPGYAAKRILFKDSDFDPVESVSISFGLSLSILCIPLLIFYYLRLGLGECSKYIYIIIGLLLILYFVFGRAKKHIGTNLVNIILLIILTLIAVIYTYIYLGYAYNSNMADLWYYLSFVKKMFSSGIANPSNPFIQGEGVEFVYGYNIWFLLLAVISKAAGIEPLNTWSLFAPLLCGVYISALYCLAKNLFDRKIAVISVSVFVVYELIFVKFHHFLHSPRPNSINVFVLSLLALVFVIRYLRGGPRLFLLAAAFINFTMAFLHFVEPLACIMVLCLFWIGFVTIGSGLRDKTTLSRLTVSIIALTVGFSIAYLMKMGLGQPDPAYFLKSAGRFAISPPVYVFHNIFMVSPFLFLRTPVIILGLPAALLALTRVKKDMALLLMLSSIIGMFIIQFNPFLATSLSSIFTYIFVRKGMSINQVFYFILWGYVIDEFFGKRMIIPGSFLKRRSLMALIAFIIIIALPALLYVIANSRDLTAFTHNILNITQRHELKTMLEGFALCALFFIFMFFVAMEPSFRFVTRFSEKIFKKRGYDYFERYAAKLSIFGLLSLALLTFLISERRMTDHGKPYPRFYDGIASKACKYLNNYSQPLTVMMTNLGDLHNMNKETLRVDTARIYALTPHYGVSMYNPGFKLTKCGLDYEKRYNDVALFYSGDMGIDDMRVILAEYNVDLIYVKGKNVQNEKLKSTLETMGHIEKVLGDNNAAVYRYTKEQ